MRIPLRLANGSSFAKRSDGSNNKSLIFVSAIVISIFILLIVAVLIFRRYRLRQLGKRVKGSSSSTRSISGWSWRKWRKRPRTAQYSSSLQEDDGNELERASRSESRAQDTTDPERQTTAAGVDRNTSVRSVMTLPAYSPAARENERILGREGERGGIDTVVEFPETVDEEEERRENEMESLYQIRLARRNENREREARRQERREARQRGDTAALAEIRRRAESAASESVSQQLIAEHQVNVQTRDRRVSSVQYGDLGLARHDGTRLRANSSESDNRPLLDSAASIGGFSQRSRTTSNTLPTHFRGASASSVISISTRASDEFDFSQPHTRASGERSSPDEFEVVSLSQSRSRSASRGPSTPNNASIPATEPPRYDDHLAFEEAPPYESPVSSRAPQLPTLERLPSIQVTQEPSPVEGRSNASFAGQR